MRYVVKVVDGFEIINEWATNDLSEAIAKEAELRKLHGTTNVWIADAVQEILVG
jgi:hypothetical protein